MAALLVDNNIDYLVHWEDGSVMISIDGAPAVEAFALENESGLAIVKYPDGRYCIVYQDADGDPQRKFSTDGGITWSDP